MLLVSLIGDYNQEWRNKNFEVLGNAKALQQAYSLAKKVIVADDKEGKDLAKVVAST